MNLTQRVTRQRRRSPPAKRSERSRPTTFFRTVADVVASGPVLFEAAFHPKISAALREKLFLAVSSINDCRYCKWGHTHWAMAQGVPLEEVNQILGHQAESLVAKNPAEAAAILFAQHYAEQLDQFDPESMENLRKYYSDAEVAEILAYVRFITLTNLTGNTVDAFLTGAHGQRQPQLLRGGDCRGGLTAGATAHPTGQIRFQGRDGRIAVRTSRELPRRTQIPKNHEVDVPAADIP